jgi:iron complex outermembrane receptor protein
MVGVNILQMGTQNGTTTDANGKFSIDVPYGSTVLFSFIGYKDRMVNVTKSMTMNVLLVNQNQQLDELIVIGYATQKKSDKTGAVANIKAEDLNGGMITDPVQAMQGKVSGVTVTKKGGDPNEGFAIRIRGASGYESNTQPLYVIDGVPGADPTMLSPDDIASYNILKDAASAAIYGSRGSNGVIIITTKKGSAGSSNCNGTFSRIDFNSQVSFDKVANKVNVLSADQMRAYAAKYATDSTFTDGGASTDWQDQIYRRGVSYSTNLSLSGGNASTNYLGSITRANWQGVMRGTSKDRTTARLNINHKSFNDRINITGGIMTSFENNDYENYDGFDKDDIIYQALSRNPTDPVYNADGSYYKANREFNYENPLAVINEITNLADQDKYLGNLKADFEVVKGLILSANVAYMSSVKKTDYFRPANLYASADAGYGKKQYDNWTQKIMELTANYTKSFNKKHNLELLGGYSFQESMYNGFYAQAGNAQSEYAGPDNLKVLGDVNWGDIGSWKGKSNLIGFFGRAQYNFDHKYYASASLRRDGSSKFGANNKWGWFPTAAIGWNIDKESFLNKVEWLNQLKLRASYGVSGNQEIGEYHSLLMWQPSGKAVNPETGQEVITFSPVQNANPNLKWEETKEINIGIDFAFFNNKVSGSLEVYQKNTDDLLGSYRVPVPPNLASTTWANSGSIDNKGVELFVQIFALDKKNIDWKTTINISKNKTIISDLGTYVDGNIRKEGYLSGRGIIGDEIWVTGLITGEEAGTFYLPKYVALKDGKFIYESESGGYTTDLAQAKRYAVGTAAPDLEIGWSNSFTFYKKWNLDFAFRSMIGNYVYNATAMFFDNPGNLPSLNALEEAIDWKEEGRTASTSLADIYVENASFLKLDFVALSYSFDTDRIKMVQNFSLFVSANNLLTITGYSGTDPETTVNGLSFGVDQYNVYPKTRSVTFGFKASF